MQKYLVFLCFANVTMLIVSTFFLFTGITLVSFYDLDKIDFLDPLFSVTPHYIISLSVITFVLSLFGMVVMGLPNRCTLIAYAAVTALVFLAQLGGVAVDLELRNIMQDKIISVKPNLEMKRYQTDSAVKTKWDKLQRNYHCCGFGGNEFGLTEWTVANIPEDSVPDSCCVTEHEQCGSGALNIQNYRDTAQRYFVHGCQKMMEYDLDNYVQPTLVVYAAVGTILAILELTIVVMACAFAAAITRKARNNAGGTYLPGHIDRESHFNDGAEFPSKIYETSGRSDVL